MCEQWFDRLRSEYSDFTHVFVNVNANLWTLETNNLQYCIILIILQENDKHLLSSIYVEFLK